MLYHFLDFTLDSKTSELKSEDQVVLLKQKPFLLLQCLLKNPQEILSKDFLLKEVWDDRLVSDNTIAQTVGQLRQLLGDDAKNPDIIITHRGRGISFSPTVETQQKPTPTQPDAPQSRRWPWLIAAIPVLLVWVYFYHGRQAPKPASTQPKLLVINEASDDWLNSSTPQLFTQLMVPAYSGQVVTENIDKNTELREYLDRQWSINADLNVLTTEFQQDDMGFSLQLNLTDENQVTQSKRLTARTINEALLLAYGWLNEQMEVEISTEKILKNIPSKPPVMELYLHGLAAFNEADYDKAAQYYELALAESPEFHLARLALANAYKHLGKMDEAITQLDILQNTSLYPQLELEAINTRGYIFDIQGKYQEAKVLFESALAKYHETADYQLNPIRFELSYVLARLGHNDQAMTQLDHIIQTTTLSTDPQLLADAFHKKSSLSLTAGQVEQAEQLAKQSMSTYIKMGLLLGSAKVHSQLSRINTLKNDYDQAKYHLHESLRICKELEYPLGVGANLNELVYVLIREGDFEQAEKLNTEMADIAIEIEYTHMLIASKQHAAALAIHKQQWELADDYIQQQHELARSTENMTALRTGQLLLLEKLVSQQSTAGADEALQWLEQNLDETQESRLRLALDLRRAQLQAIDGYESKAIELLTALKSQAKATKDQETLIEINNTLASLYLPSDPEKAMSITDENSHLNAVPYPHQLIRSKALLAMGEPEASLAQAIACKNAAGQHWKRHDEAFLSQLRLSQP